MTTTRSGDVVAIPVTHERVAVGHVVAVGHSVLLAAFLDLHDARTPIDVATLDLDDPILVARVLGTAIERGEWAVVGHRDVSPAIHVTTYKVGTSSGEVYLHEDVHGNDLGTIGHEQARRIPTSTVSSDDRVPGALRGLHGFAPWTEHDDDLVAPIGHPTDPCDCQRVIAARRPEPSDGAAEHAVITTYRLGDDRYGSEAERAAVRAMQDRLAARLDEAGVGELDGDEFGAGAVTVYAYGPDADALFTATRDVLADLDLRPATVVLRYGSADDDAAREVEIAL